MNVTTILGSLLAEMKKPPVADVTISDQAVSDFATRMMRRGYVPSEHSLLAIEKYLQGFGLWLSGGVGTGKTFFFECLPSASQIVILPMLSTVGRSIDNLRDWLYENEGSEVVLDDIGTEPVFSYYGSRFEILPWLLERRMDTRARTHLTSNLTAKLIVDRYGARVLDRFAEYFFKVDFVGESRRKPRPRVKPVKNAVSRVGGVMGG